MTDPKLTEAMEIWLKAAAASRVFFDRLNGASYLARADASDGNYPPVAWLFYKARNAA